jgi:undecaprenyl-phosphate galactose phosphotransferase
MGHILRKTSLDELAQIINVLKGEMSLVGTRPYLPIEREDIGEHTSLILETRPGITGLWQVSGRNELTFNERVKLDAWYVLNWSLWSDIFILIKTIKVVLKGKGSF